jgi:hypothetical protein
MHSILRNILFSLIIILPFNSLFSQDDPFVRLEIAVKSDEASYRVVPCDHAGVVLFYESAVQEDKYHFWVFTLFNKLLKENWKKEIPVIEQVNYQGHIVAEKYLYVLFYAADVKKDEPYNYQVLKLSLIDGSYEIFSGEIPKKSIIADFNIFNDFAVIGIDIGERESGLFYINTITKETKTLYKTNAEFEARFESIYIDTARNTLSGIFNLIESKDKFYLMVKEFNSQAKEIKETRIIPETGKKFNTAKITRINDNKRIVIGTYDLVQNNADLKSYFNNEATGFFTSVINERNEVKSNYYNFIDFVNKVGFKQAKEYKKIKSKAKKDKDGSDNYSLDYDLLIHDLIVRDDQVYFIVEAFYEEYHTITSTYYDYYMRPVMTSYSVFDGYRYFNSFISCFDTEGKMNWDNGMEIYNILSPDLKNRVNIYFNEEEIIMAYNYEGKVTSKIIKGAEVIEGTDNFQMDSNYLNDKIIDDTKGHMEHWYDNFFVAYGFQAIRNNSLPNKNRRTVFYINKLGFK